MSTDWIKFGVEFARSLFKAISDYSRKKKELASMMILAKSNYTILSKKSSNSADPTYEQELAESYFRHCVPPILLSEKKKEKIYELIAIAYEYLFYTKDRFHLEKVISDWDEFVKQSFIRLGYHLNKTIIELMKEYQDEIDQLEGKTFVEVEFKEEGKAKVAFKPVKQVIGDVVVWSGERAESPAFTIQSLKEVKQEFLNHSGIKYDTDTSSGFYVDTRINRALKATFEPELPEEE